ncbi:MAG: hypothetical protein HZB38_01790 [Planctomycetes bacterium]|nr:hypothetical protein [Planctomycetota bacterium]
MIRKLYGILAFVSLAAVLAGGGLAGYLFGAGKLNAARVERIASVLRGELDEMPSAASQPASQPATQPTVARHQSAEEIRQRRHDDRIQRAVLGRASRDVAAQRDLLNQVMQDVIARTDELDRGRKAWADEKEKFSATARDEGFERELKYVSKLDPPLAKDHLLTTWKKQKADAVRLFSALPESAGKRILQQMKTPEERQIMSELLEQLRNQGADSLAPRSGTTSADASK